MKSSPCLRLLALKRFSFEAAKPIKRRISTRAFQNAPTIVGRGHNAFSGRREKNKMARNNRRWKKRSKTRREIEKRYVFKSSRFGWKRVCFWCFRKSFRSGNFRRVVFLWGRIVFEMRIVWRFDFWVYESGLIFVIEVSCTFKRQYVYDSWSLLEHGN